ncbi:MAG: hypothetical protein ACODAJ_01290 [Planctomycetota bacterium]
MGKPLGAKPRKRILRRLAAEAYRRELEQALAKLEKHFAAWRSGEIDAFKLEQRIHEFHNGIARDLWKRYEQLNPNLSLPRAVAVGVLVREEVPSELLAQWDTLIEDYQREAGAASAGSEGAGEGAC